MSSSWFGRLSYLRHEIDDALNDIRQTAQSADVQRDLRLCDCAERVALVNCVLLEVDTVAQLCQVCGEFLLEASGRDQDTAIVQAADRLNQILEVAFLKVRWAQQLCHGGRGEEWCAPAWVRNTEEPELLLQVTMT